MNVIDAKINPRLLEADTLSDVLEIEKVLIYSKEFCVLRLRQK